MTIHPFGTVLNSRAASASSIQKRRNSESICKPSITHLTPIQYNRGSHLVAQRCHKGGSKGKIQGMVRSCPASLAKGSHNARQHCAEMILLSSALGASKYNYAILVTPLSTTTQIMVSKSSLAFVRGKRRKP